MGEEIARIKSRINTVSPTPDFLLASQLVTKVERRPVFQDIHGAVRHFGFTGANRLEHRQVNDD
ncbi:hypothetical protein WKW50_25825 [Ochrobactrum sp. GPK 3]|uniref:hypothetical protein n=1 Tax=Brucella sp. 22210 TaxID=3453892 RepID=UPI0031384F07